MADLFKNLFSEELMAYTAQALQQVNCSFNKELFTKQIFDRHWGDREFKERMHHIADVVRLHLSDDFKDLVQELYLMIAHFKSSGADKIKYAELAYVFIPDIIEKYGIDDVDAAIEAFEIITPFTTCEFAVRPFILKYEDKMMEQMHEWTLHNNEHVRRLASEGSRPRLPWGVALAPFKQNPDAILPIVEALKNDPSEYVRRSVANNLNDISKDHPDKVMALAKAWMGHSKETDWVVKHACRTLLKAGNSEVLELFGFCYPDNIEVHNFQLTSDDVAMGSSLEFQFTLHNLSDNSEKIRLEYAIHFLKKSGVHNKKVFKISEKSYAAKSQTVVTRKQSFKPVSTRRLYAGEHIVSLIINGVTVEERTFQLL